MKWIISLNTSKVGAILREFTAKSKPGFWCCMQVGFVFAVTIAVTIITLPVIVDTYINDPSARSAAVKGILYSLWVVPLIIVVIMGGQIRKK
jgi:ABC-type sugar transport system permease subunit